MANKLYDENNIKAIADAIRGKNSSTDTYKVGEMAEAISKISGGDNSMLEGIIAGDSSHALAVYDFSALSISNIRTYAFYRFDNGNQPCKIILPAQIVEIPALAFNYATALQELITPGKISKLGSYAFGTCSNLMSVNLSEDLTEIPSYAFRACANLNLTNLPAAVSTIENGAFYECTNLAITELPSSLADVGESSFYNCSSLALKELPSSLTNIGKQAFYGCTNLAITELPSSLVNIGSYAFQKCTNLTKMTLNNSDAVLKTQYIFQNCTNLKTLKIRTQGLQANNVFGNLSLEKIWIASTCTSILAGSITSHVFWNSGALNIYCEATQKPTDWGTYWYYYSQTYSSAATVHWGVTEEEFDALDDTTETA